MRRSLFVFVFLCMMLVSHSGAARAALPAEEMPLNPNGTAFEVHADAQGNLWVSEYTRGELWKVAAGVSSANVYAVGGNPSDATPDSAGAVWWVDGGNLNRMDSSANLQTWKVTNTGPLYGLVLDGQGRVWVSDSKLANVYRFSSANNTLCTYTIPDAGKSYYLAATGNRTWLGDYVNGRLLRLDSSTSPATWTRWQLPTDSRPEDVVLDAAGNAWYADANLTTHVIGRLEPDSGRLTAYSLPPGLGIATNLLTSAGGKIWYTETSLPSMGILDPAKAAGSVSFVIPDSPALSVDTCPVVQPSPPKIVASRNMTPTWTAASYLHIPGPAGWAAFQLPAGAVPWGVAVTDYGWVVDSKRQVLMKTALKDETRVFLPSVKR